MASNGQKRILDIKPEEKQALLEVYRSFQREGGPSAGAAGRPAAPGPK